jgi:hypothetical protein
MKNLTADEMRVRIRAAIKRDNQQGIWRSFWMDVISKSY